MKTFSGFLPMVLASLFCSAISVVATYFIKVLPLQEAIQEMRRGDDDQAVKECAFEITLAASLREAKQDQVLIFFDKKTLPPAIRILKRYSDSDAAESRYSKYLLWKIKKYSNDFSVIFPPEEMEIINKIPDEYSSLNETTNAGEIRKQR